MLRRFLVAHWKKKSSPINTGTESGTKGKMRCVAFPSATLSSLTWRLKVGPKAIDCDKDLLRYTSLTRCRTPKSIKGAWVEK